MVILATAKTTSNHDPNNRLKLSRDVAALGLVLGYGFDVQMKQTNLHARGMSTSVSMTSLVDSLPPVLANALRYGERS
jgi:hypothetical protein